MSKKPFILITNDDGIGATGIKELWQALYHFADLAIVAPLTERSGSSVSYSSSPLFIQTVKWDKNTPAWSVSGTPADCVKLALSSILHKKPDLIVSGINEGPNSGRTFWCSGTVGSIIEGVLHDIPGIAFSYEEPENPQLAPFEKYISLIAQYFLNNSLPQGVFLNVTFPKSAPKGIKLSKQGKSLCSEDLQQKITTDGQKYYLIGGKWIDMEELPSSDVTLLKEGFITVVPIQIADLTHHDTLESHKDKFEGLFNSFFSQNETVKKREII